MKSGLIDRQKLIASVRNTMQFQPWQVALFEAIADAEPDCGEVKTARWVIRPDDGTAECSECRRIMFLPMRCIENPAEIPYRYCDMCGAKMDGGKDEQQTSEA